MIICKQEEDEKGKLLDLVFDINQFQARGSGLV